MLRTRYGYCRYVITLEQIQPVPCIGSFRTASQKYFEHIRLAKLVGDLTLEEVIRLLQPLKASILALIKPGTPVNPAQNVLRNPDCLA